MLAAALFAVWLGILTSISPCPLASNIAALSFITKELRIPRRTLAAGVSYAFGRAFTYVILALFIVGSLVTVPHLSLFLQATVSKILGPLLIVIGMFLLGLVSIPFLDTRIIDQETAAGLQAKGLKGAFALGVLLALAFCPVSAALYFGTLIPLSIGHVSWLLLPAAYGLGTALPVVFFALVLTSGAEFVTKAFDLVSAFDKWSSRVTGVLFIILGVYLSLVHVFGVL